MLPLHEHDVISPIGDVLDRQHKTGNFNAGHHHIEKKG